MEIARQRGIVLGGPTSKFCVRNTTGQQRFHTGREGCAATVVDGSVKQTPKAEAEEG